MLKKIVATLCLVAFTLGSEHVGRASTTAPTAMKTSVGVNGEDPAITRRAKKAFADLRAGKVDRSQFASVVLDALTPDAVAQASHMLNALGALGAFRFVTVQNGEDGAPSSLYVVQCAKGTIHYAFGVNAQGKVDVFAFQ